MEPQWLLLDLQVLAFLLLDFPDFFFSSYPMSLMSFWTLIRAALAESRSCFEAASSADVSLNTAHLKVQVVLYGAHQNIWHSTVRARSHATAH